MTQAQILFSLLGAASPALKKTMLDLQTNYGASESQSNSRTGYGGSFAMKYLNSSKRNMNNSHLTDSRDRNIPFSGPGVKGTASIHGRSRNDERRITSDGDSQEGIIRQDDYEVSYDYERGTPDLYRGDKKYAKMR